MKKRAFALLALALPAMLLWGVAQQADAAVYYAAGTQVGRANLDGTGANSSFIATTSTEVAGVAVNEEFVYWSDAAAGTINRAKLDGSGAETIVTGATSPEAIALASEYVYWTNAGAANTIGRARLDGSEAEGSFITGAQTPTGVAVDFEHIYWTNAATNSIGRANLDGSEANQSYITGADKPAGIAVNFEHIFWANSGTGTIGRANLDGSEAEQGFITGATVPRSVSIDAEHIYWSNFGAADGTTYGRAEIGGGGAEESFITVGAGQPFGIAADARRAATTTVTCGPGFTGQATTCTAKVTDTESGSPAQATGTVTFSTTGAGTFGSGETCSLVGRGTGVAECHVAYTPAATGTETITAAYGGGPTTDAGKGTTELSVATPLSPTRTTTVCTPSPLYPKVEATCVTTVVDTSSAPTPPLGEVHFTTDKNGTLLDGPTCTLTAEGTDRASCTFHYIAEFFGYHPITAMYPGTVTQNPSTGYLPLEVSAVHKATSALSCATNPPVLATVPVTCTVTIFDKGFPVAPPTGLVTFASDGGGTFAPATCVPTPAGKESASCTTVYTPAVQGLVGLYTAFEGPPGYEPTRALTGLKVGPAPVAPTALTCAPGFQPSGDPPVCKEPSKISATAPPKPRSFSRNRPLIDRETGTAMLPVYLPRAGRVVVGGAGVVKVTKKVTAAGQVKFTVKATGGAARTLRRKGHVTVAVQVTYTPTGGKPRKMKVPVHLLLAAKNKETH
jgi:virginiamycin B lyase